jgi:signal transduction histidine kinase
MNLVANAIDACPEGGCVAIRTRAVDGGVTIRVEDDGCGIDPAIRSKLFDPFFTTKPVGQGTGLGLSISYGIVQDHRGRLDVESELGKGAAFTLFLPVGDGANDSLRRNAVPSA